MTNTLRHAIDELAASFANAVTSAIRGASLDDILSLSGTEAHGAARSGKSAAPGKASTKATQKAFAPAAGTAPKAAAPAKKSTKSGRLARRSPGDIAKALSAVVELVKKNPKGLRAEQIRTELDMEAKEMPRILKEGLAKKALKSKGQKRSTTYTAG